MRVGDTIVGPITASGRGAVALVRLSGADSWTLAGRVAQPWNPEHATARLVGYAHGDEGLATPFEAGRSYTGERSVELSVHGSPASVQALIEACLSVGARAADPGEFTLRAFANGRIDLTQAEGVREGVEALTAEQLRRAHALRSGLLKRTIDAIRERLQGVLAQIEVSIDFSEETGDLDVPKADLELRRATDRIQELLARAKDVELLRDGLGVALVGQPNAGKSSLLNAILQRERAIVTDVPGTTRDTLEERVEVSGRLVRLIDTAGLRRTTDSIEVEGVRRTYAEVERADVVWYVYDAAKGWTDQDDALLPDAAVIVANKVDLAEPERGIPISALSGQGVADLLATLESDHASPPLITVRHVRPLGDAVHAIEEARDALAEELPGDLAAVGVRSAIRSLGEITGDTHDADALDRLFADFCIGK